MKEKKPAIFLDRDGVLTKEIGYVDRVDKMVVFSYVKDCIKKIKERGYYAIVITNQSGVAKGIVSMDELTKMNKHLISEVGVNAVYFCPHHSDEDIKYMKNPPKLCNCRKPGIGLIEMACQDFDINLKESWMVGDRGSDILMAKNAKIKSVLLESGYGVKHLKGKIRADYYYKDLRDFVDSLFNMENV